MTDPAAQDPTPQEPATEDANPEAPTTGDLQEPSTEKEEAEEPSAPPRTDPEVDHEAVGIGVIGRPLTDDGTSAAR